TEDGLGNHASKAGGGVSADGAGDHSEQTIAPNDLAIDHEDDEGNTVGQRGGDYFEGVDLVQVLVAEEREEGDHKEAGPGAEVADVEADNDGGNEDRQAARRMGAAWRREPSVFKPAGDWTAGGKDGGGHEQQPG